MRILIIGGTQFVGRHITAAALAAGHEVSLLHRGRTGPDLFPEAEHLTADRNADLSILRGRRWDATIDVSAYLPPQIDSLADALSTATGADADTDTDADADRGADRGTDTAPDAERRESPAGRALAAGRYVFISSTAVYTVPPAPGFSEDSPLAEIDGPVPQEVTGETYGALKVLCERTAVARFGPGTLVVRPTYVIGPHDHTGRFTYWVNRIARGGEVLAPGDPSDPIQVIDGRDMASWIIGMLEKAGDTSARDGVAPAGAEIAAGTGGGSGTAGPGTFHAVSPAPPFSFGDMLETILAEVGPPGTTLTWVGQDFLLAEGEDGRSLPLWSEGNPWIAVNTADPAAAHATGLSPRPLRRSVREIRESEASFSTAVTITPEREADLLARWHSR
ncbi:NAD-dependent epimerase/dehydratase family protein [Streptosporangium sp. NPDC051022]|uniref:NAD-dependent epimerase/dehydratase family protein n=1 Tax=Streptosporangium sp. NPDC051022 TaxID=3155752 RepID=UPI0034240921